MIVKIVWYYSEVNATFNWALRVHTFYLCSHGSFWLIWFVQRILETSIGTRRKRWINQIKVLPFTILGSHFKNWALLSQWRQLWKSTFPSYDFTDFLFADICERPLKNFHYLIRSFNPWLFPYHNMFCDMIVENRLKIVSSIELRKETAFRVSRGAHSISLVGMKYPSDKLFKLIIKSTIWFNNVQRNCAWKFV